MGSSTKIRQLHRLARAHGIQTTYEDVQKRRQQASPETLIALLGALGVELASLEEAPSALADHERARAARPLPEVIVAWDGKLPEIPLHYQQGAAPDSALFRLRAEDGAEHTWRCRLAVTKRGQLAAACELEQPLPSGYHTLFLEVSGREHEAMIISAPKRSYTRKKSARTWGLFVPLYALQSETSWGAGTFADLQSFWNWTNQRGGGLVATLPLLAAFLDEPFEPSPYSPVSRLFWNEFYIDLQQFPGLEQCESAHRMVASEQFQNELRELRNEPMVDYRRVGQLKRRVLEQLAQSYFSDHGQQRDAVEQFLEQRPEVDDYARFRAVCYRRKQGWSQWPERLRDGHIADADYDRQEWQYHVFAQWLAHEQVRQLSEEARRSGPGLYLDLPLGVHRDGYDTWRERQVFALGASGGAPPDTFFTKGQNWGFAPLHPARLRAQKYRHWIALLRHHLAHAGMLRIDHVMGLHRLYWIPDGMPAREGAYVQYAADELYAILSLESHRSQSTIVGENLGTVPPAVNTSMKRHGVGQMYVVQYEANPKHEPVLPKVPRRSVASLNTHDMFPLAAFWEEDDLDDLHVQGLFDDEQVAVERQNRQQLRERLMEFLIEHQWLEQDESANLTAIVDALHSFLAASDTDIALVNVEDLWLERAPQNMPGTSLERPNWRRKTKYAVEEMGDTASIDERLTALTDLRSGRKPAKWPKV